MRHPWLNLGLLGFTDEQREQVQTFLALNEAGAQGFASYEDEGPLLTHPIWRISDFREANALLINTQNAHIDSENGLRFQVDPLRPNVVGVRPSDLAIPYAVCGALAKKIQDSTINQIPTMVLDDQRSMVRVLQYFEAQLRPLRAVYALAHELMERRQELDKKHTYHLMREGTLDAIVDVPQSRVMLRDGLRPVDLDAAAWQSRPASANALPHGFALWMLEEVVWMHALHCHTFILPSRYYNKPLYLRRLPRVRASMVYPRHVALLEVMTVQAHTYDDLIQLFPDQDALLQRDLYALYICRAITTDPNGFVASNNALTSRFNFHFQTAPTDLV
jgi:hypothetical protein